MAEKKFKMLWVKGAGKDGKVVLNERHDAHPETAPGRHHEAFVSNDGYAYHVAETPLVKRLLGEGLLVEANESESYENQRVNWNSRTEDNGEEAPKNKGGRPKKNGTSVPPLRPATNSEEDNAEPPVDGEVDEATARVPKGYGG